jgi:hypothetical protein
MRLRHLFNSLYETPIEDYQLVGDFNKAYSFHNKVDRRLVSNPRYVERIKNMFAKTEFDFRMYFVNSREAKIGLADPPQPGERQRYDPFLEEGAVTLAWLQDNMPEGLAQIQQQGGFNSQGINMIFTNNRGDERAPMTGWIIAHRIGHSVLRPTHGGNDSFFQIEKEIKEKLQYILQMYGVRIPQRGYPGGWSKTENYDDPMMLRFMAQIGSSKAARDNNLRTFAEFNYECFAQYLIAGAVKLNPAPPQFIKSYTYGRPSYSHRLGGPEQSEANYAIEYMAGMMEQEFERALHAAVGKIFVM